MKIIYRFFCFIYLLVISASVNAQHFKNADEYLNFIGKQHKEIAEKVTDYCSDLATGKGKKSEDKRKEILSMIKTASLRIKSMHPYKVDKSFQDSAIHYLSTTNQILTTQVPVVLKLEDSLGKSASSTQKLLEAKENTISNLAKAEERLNSYGKVFVSKYHLKEEYNDDVIFKKLQEINKANSYYKAMYLVYLKNSSREALLVQAISRKDTVTMKEHNTALARFVKEGMIMLDSISGYNKDNSLLLATKQVLQFYQVETEFKVPVLISSLTKEAAFQRFQKSFNSKKESERTQEEKDQLIRETAEHNEYPVTYSNTVNDLNAERPKVIENWNKVSKEFLEKNVL